MNCPRCRNVMTEMERHEVTVDVCGNCGGIWLDRGELAKILSHMREAEASLDMELNAARERDRNAQYPPSYRHERDDHHHERRHEDDHQYSHRKKTGFQRLFDIFD